MTPDDIVVTLPYDFGEARENARHRPGARDGQTAHRKTLRFELVAKVGWRGHETHDIYAHAKSRQLRHERDDQPFGPAPECERIDDREDSHVVGVFLDLRT